MLPKGKILSTILGILLIYIGFTPMLRSIENNNLPTYFAFSLLGEVLIIDNTFPLLFDLLHNKVLLKSKNWIISLSNLKDLTDVMTAMINISAVVVPIIISFLFLQSVSIDVQNAMMMSFCINGVNVPLFYYSLYDLFANPSFSNCNNAGFRLQQKVFLRFITKR